MGVNNRQQKEVLIVQSAIKLFSSQGFHATTMDSVAKQARISKGLTYFYFKNKEDLYMAVTRHAFEELNAVFQADNENRKGLELILDCARRFFKFVEENNMYHVMMNGTEEKMFKSYKKDRNYFATTIDFTIGYEKKIGKKNQLRIQPYLQLPVKGIGVGKLPLKSAGIRIAFTHNQ